MLHVPPEFQGVLDSDEHLLWSGRPTAWPFFLTGVPFLILGIIWGVIDLGFIQTFMKGGASSHGPGMMFVVPFFLLHLAPLWLSVGNMLRLLLVFNNTHYGFTNKRLMLRGGFWGTDFKSIDYDAVQEMEVTVNPIENMLKVGTIRVFTGRTTSKGANLYDRFIGISNPYQVYKQLKQVSVDIKTDWNYPNALRPETNPGYPTGYEPREPRR